MTPEQRKIADFIKDHKLCRGLGTKDSACSIASINLALTGKLTDNIPECVSSAIGRWIIVIQDVMPDDMRNGNEWRNLLPYVAGTGRDRETERLNIILDWMWSTVLPQVSPIADRYGFSTEWTTMLKERTADAAANAARTAADAAYAAYAARAAYAAVGAARAARAARTAADAAYAAYAARAAYAAVGAARAARAARTAAGVNFWQAIDPPTLLAKLIKI